MERHERPSAQVGLLRHPPSENISGAEVVLYESLPACMNGGSVGGGFARRGWENEKPGVQDSGVY